MSGLYLILLPVTIICVVLTVSCCIILNGSEVILSEDEMLEKQNLLGELLHECFIYKSQDMQCHNKWIEYLTNLRNEIISLKDLNYNNAQLHDIFTEGYRNERITFFHKSLDLNVSYDLRDEKVKSLLNPYFEQFFSGILLILNNVDQVMQTKFLIIKNLEAEINLLLYMS